MKMDMGGAAALLGGFQAAVASGYDGELHLLLCLAENAIGSKAFRHDDIVRLLSGNSCEINNTDAEGRLVLADGVAYASCVPPRLPSTSPPALIIDMATLTGAQMVATGRRHAAIVCDDAEVEAAAIAAGRISGDLVHALPFCPEFFRAEFRSKVADMKNSVKDRSNAQSSCAATFVYEQLHKEYKGAWLHVDMAGPAFAEDRATGYGVALILAMLGVDGFKGP
jgi:probable aminopeptidase NPEPL1